MPAGRIKDHWGEQRRFEQRALIAGVLILLMPRLLNFIVAIYLILLGLLGLFGHSHGIHV